MLIHLQDLNLESSIKNNFMDQYVQYAKKLKALLSHVKTVKILNFTICVLGSKVMLLNFFKIKIEVKISRSII